jgi:KAP family P-loop domain
MDRTRSHLDQAKSSSGGKKAVATKSSSQEKEAVIHRWKQILVLALFGSGSASLLARLILRGFNQFLDSPPEIFDQPQVILVPLLYLTITLFMWSLMGIVPLKIGHIRRSLRYPSTWAGAGLGIILLTVAVLIASAWGFPLFLCGYSFGDWALSLLFFVPAIILAAYIRSRESRAECDLLPMQSKDGDTAQKALFEMSHDPEAILRWVEEEAPIRDRHQDALGAYPIARRLARLLRSPLGQDVSIGLCGAYGSGKSSIIHMLESELTVSSDPEVPDI